jgi:hypothetical protein
MRRCSASPDGNHRPCITDGLVVTAVIPGLRIGDETCDLAVCAYCLCAYAMTWDEQAKVQKSADEQGIINERPAR